MSDPKRSDLSVVTETEFGITWESVTDAEFDAIAQEQGYVKVWEDCPMNGTQDGQFWCDDGCADCGGSGKVPAEGVQQAANGWWIAPDRLGIGE